MNDAVLQVLLILAYLAIGLVSVTFPIYAISVNFLPQQKWESEKEREKRKNDLRAKISTMSSELKGEAHDAEQVTQLREQLDKYEAELEGTELRYQYLTASGAVGIPVTLLVFALLCAGAGIAVLYSDVQDSQTQAMLLGGGSAFFCVVALVRLYKTISAAEYGALRPARTVGFDVCYKSRKYTEQVEIGKETELTFSIGSIEQNVEKMVALIYLPPDLEIKRWKDSFSKQPEGFHFPNYTAIVVEKDFVARNVYQGVAALVLPTKVGRFQIPVTINAKGIFEYHTQLFLDVVKQE